MDAYEVKEIKPIIEEKISKYKSLKSICLLPNEIKITTDYNINSNIRSNNLGSKVENEVMKKLDSFAWLKDFCNAMLRIAIYLILDEAIYIVSALFFREKEDTVAEELSICKQTVQKVKRSALVKLHYNLENIM